MTIQGSRGKLRIFEDFHGRAGAVTVSDATLIRHNDLAIAALSGDATLDWAVDESGGVMTISGAGGAADGAALYGSPMVPASDGTMVIEVRWKSSVVTDCRLFVGFQETVSAAEPVNPFTLSGTTLTSNDGGEVVGFYFDAQATVDDFRFHASSAGAEDTAAALSYALGGATTLGALGVRANATVTAARWSILRVEIDPDGAVRGYAGDETMANVNGLTLIAAMKAGTLSTTALYFPIVITACHSTGDPLHSLDYILIEGNRDWDDA